MSLFSMKFLLFLAAAMAGYYVIPRQFRWVWLPVFSYILYLASDPATVVFILTTTATTFLGGLWLEHADRTLACALDRTPTRDPDHIPDCGPDHTLDHDPDYTLDCGLSHVLDYDSDHLRCPVNP